MTVVAMLLSSAPVGSVPIALWLVLIGLGAFLVLLGAWLLLGRRWTARRRTGRGTAEVGTPGGDGVGVDAEATIVAGTTDAGGAAAAGTAAAGTAAAGSCPDGAEEWRDDGKRRRFTVPAPGAKIQVSSEPSPANLDAWLDDWRAVDATLRPLPTPTDDRGVPPTIFVRQEPDRIRRLWEGLDGAGQAVEVTIELPLHHVQARCQRLHRCEDGEWRATEQRRWVESDPVPYPKRHVLEGADHTSGDVWALWEKASRDWEKYLPNERGLERARTRCGQDG